MKYMFFILFVLSLPIIAAQPEHVFQNKISDQAKQIGLHESMFIHATGTLAQAMTIGRDKTQDYEFTYPIENRLIAAWVKGEIYPVDINTQIELTTGVRVPLNKKTVRYADGVQAEAIKMVNEWVIKHANVLQLPALYLPRFYQLQSQAGFAWLFDTSNQTRASTELISDLIVELPCKYAYKSEFYSDDTHLKNDCAKAFRRSQPEQVARLWRLSHEAGLRDKQGFTVRYVNAQGEQVGAQEVWAHYDTMGPRYLQSLD